MLWPGWHEPVVLGRGELFGVLLAHAIIGGIALWRYKVRPWWMARRTGAEPR